MYDKQISKCDVTCSWPPPPVTNCHTFSDHLPLERDVLYGRPHICVWLQMLTIKMMKMLHSLLILLYVCVLYYFYVCVTLRILYYFYACMFFIVFMYVHSLLLLFACVLYYCYVCPFFIIVMCVFPEFSTDFSVAATDCQISFLSIYVALFLQSLTKFWCILGCLICQGVTGFTWWLLHCLYSSFVVLLKVQRCCINLHHIFSTVIVCRTISVYRQHRLFLRRHTDCAVLPDSLFLWISILAVVVLAIFRHCLLLLDWHEHCYLQAGQGQSTHSTNQTPCDVLLSF